MPTAVALDRSLTSDRSLDGVADKIEHGERLLSEDGVALFESPDIVGIGAMANAVNRAKHGGRALKPNFPHVHIKALTAVEIAHIARIEKMSIRETLIALREAGLDTMPGGGAEVFSAGVRATIADKKLAGEQWIAVHREAHQLGIRSNCTMLYGHVETYADRIAHLSMLRDLQDETGGFLAYIPLAYHPDNNELGHTLHREGTATSGFDDLKNLAIGRLYLDNIDHIKTHWVMVTPFISQTSLHFGVNDMEGTMVREKIYHEAGAHT